MNIIKSKYTAKELVAHYDSVQEKVDETIFEKIHHILKIMVTSIYGTWFLLIAYSWLFVEPAAALIALPFAILGAIIKRNERHFVIAITEHYVSKGRLPFNHLETKHFLEYSNNLELCEKILDLNEKGTLSLLKKGGSQILLFTDKDGNEETYPILRPVTEPEKNTLDFSCYDEEIGKLMERQFWPETKKKTSVQ